MRRFTSIWSTHRYLLITAGCLQFIVLTLIAMLLFPGGNHLNHDKPHYDFFRNFFSTLGRRYAHGGEPNDVSAALFITAATIAAVCLASFFVMATRLFRPKSTQQSRLKTIAYVSAILSAIFGAIASVSLIGVALFPTDVNWRWHYRFMFLTFASLLLVAIFYALAIVLSQHYPKRYAIALGAFILLLAGYLLLLTQGPGIRTARGLFVQATAQKVIVYSAMLTMLWQGIGAHRVYDRLASGNPSP